MSGSLSPTLARVVGHGLCSGCGACAAITPSVVSMEMTEEGLLRPTQSEPINADQDRAIANVCPGVSLHQTSTEGVDDPLWGPVVRARTGWATDPALRYAASSGGGLSAVLVSLLASKRVDAVLQTRANRDEPLGTETTLSRTAADVLEASGSRYAPSAPLTIVSDLLDSQERIAFVGKPCDVAALRAMARHDDRINRVFPVLISFFCAGVPSQRGAEKILTALQVERSEVTAFRYRGYGWPGFATATLRDGQEAKMSYFDSWGGILSANVQARCRICPDGTGGFADIVCADAWETDEQGYPIFEERDGISLVLSRTKLGEAIVSEASKTDHIEVKDFDLADLAAMQPGQLSKRQLTLPRMIGLRIMGRPVPRYGGFYLLRNMKTARPGVIAKNFLGMIRRVLSGRI
ncbi:MAG: Coenzyme F420 hydrogenase/dehydrogenase, beta subunit C-terminal domain [Pseudomonadota bacterium]